MSEKLKTIAVHDADGLTFSKLFIEVNGQVQPWALGEQWLSHPIDPHSNREPNEGTREEVRRYLDNARTWQEILGSTDEFEEIVIHH